MGSYKCEIKTIDRWISKNCWRNNDGKEKLRKGENYDHLRKLPMNEPRGHKDMFGSILVEPINKQCDIGVIFMDSDSYLNMCGQGSIGTVTMCINTGLIEKKEKVLVDTSSFSLILLSEEVFSL